MKTTRVSKQETQHLGHKGMNSNLQALILKGAASPTSNPQVPAEGLGEGRAEGSGGGGAEGPGEGRAEPGEVGRGEQERFMQCCITPVGRTGQAAFNMHDVFVFSSQWKISNT